MGNTLRSFKGVLFFLFVLTVSAQARPKYGPEKNPWAVPLAESNEYFRKSGNASPDFWGLISYYQQQKDDTACSVASVAAVLNTALNRLPRKYEDVNVSQDDLLKKVKTNNWKNSISMQAIKGGYTLSLDSFAKIVEDTFKAYGFNDAVATAVHVSDTSEKTLNEVRKILEKNEASDSDFIIANFDGQYYIHDTYEWGHIAPVGAYDKSTDRVLIMDPYRSWYSPYWVGADHFVKGMATKDKDAKDAFRGYVYVVYKK